MGILAGMQCLTLILNSMWKSRNQFMKAYQKMLRKLCLEICPKVVLFHQCMDSGSLVSRFSYRTTAKFCWCGAIMALVSIKLVAVYNACTTWFSCISSLKFLAQAFKRGGKGKSKFPSPPLSNACCAGYFWFYNDDHEGHQGGFQSCYPNTNFCLSRY